MNFDERDTSKDWIGVDLDRTLAIYHSGDYDRYGKLYIGKPIWPMVFKVREILKLGSNVKIFTARVADPDPAIVEAIENWCLVHIGQKLQVTNQKDWYMQVLYDDRCIQVEKNTGILVTGKSDDVWYL